MAARTERSPPPPARAAVSPWRAGLACRCPRCGEGALFEGFLKIGALCRACGLDLGRHDTGDGPAVFLIFIIGTIAVPLAIWVEVAWAVPAWLPATVGGVFAVAATLVLLRPAKALVVALQYRHRL